VSGEPRPAAPPASPTGSTRENIATLVFSARPARLRLVRALVSEVARVEGCSTECVRDMVIAVDEACQNVIRHAYAGNPDGEIRLEIGRDGDCLTVDLIDFADPVDPARVGPRDLDDVRPGGLGTHFIRACMDEAAFRAPPRGAGNRLWMSKRIE
jgi:anti-sigma regulatory factor (Ser/Thr protein kinase)